MGDAAGIGPEIIIKALNDPAILSSCRPVIIGDRGVIERTAAKLGIVLDTEAVAIKDLANLPEVIHQGMESAECGKAAGEYIEAAVEMWRAGDIEAISTAPISKHSLGLGGYPHPGHTEFLASLTGTERFAMSFFGGSLRVVLVSTHVPLRDAIELVKKERLVDLIRFSSEQFSCLLKKKVRLAVAGLNPHASENGMFGSEEEAEMSPAIAECRDVHGIDVSGPYSPDTIFLRAFKGEFDAVVACYHDQATIAVKSLAFGSAVNVTLGLPLIRTSVDHGTALDIAGKGIADASSMQAAIKLAAELASSASWT
jgi:4-phospho-D-threonate 3-dehydrogenase / 4-phospho-D-erythronate 3-dehydrogenase